MLEMEGIIEIRNRTKVTRVRFVFLYFVDGSYLVSSNSVGIFPNQGNSQ